MSVRPKKTYPLPPSRPQCTNIRYFKTMGRVPESIRKSREEYWNKVDAERERKKKERKKKKEEKAKMKEKKKKKEAVAVRRMTGLLDKPVQIMERHTRSRNKPSRYSPTNFAGGAEATSTPSAF